MNVRENLHRMADTLPETKIKEVLDYLERSGESPIPAFFTAGPEEWERLMDKLRVDPSIPVLSDEATTREYIYEDER